MLPGALIVIAATASCGCCGHEIAEAAMTMVVASPIQSNLPRPVRLVNGFDPLACGLRIYCKAGGSWRVGVLLRDGRVMSDGVIYAVEKW